MEIDSFRTKENTQKEGYKNFRDKLIKKAVRQINFLRKGTNWENKIETADKLARRINQNPFLAGKENDSELMMVLTECERRKNYAYLYSLLKN